MRFDGGVGFVLAFIAVARKVWADSGCEFVCLSVVVFFGYGYNYVFGVRGVCFGPSLSGHLCYKCRCQGPNGSIFHNPRGHVSLTRLSMPPVECRTVGHHSFVLPKTDTWR